MNGLSAAAKFHAWLIVSCDEQMEARSAYLLTVVKGAALSRRSKPVIQVEDRDAEV